MQIKCSSNNNNKKFISPYLPMTVSNIWMCICVVLLVRTTFIILKDFFLCISSNDNQTVKTKMISPYINIFAVSKSLANSKYAVILISMQQFKHFKITVLVHFQQRCSNHTKIIQGSQKERNIAFKQHPMYSNTRKNDEY